MSLICKDETPEKDPQSQITASEIMKSSVFVRTCKIKSHPSNTQRYVRHGQDLKWKSQGFACLSRAIWNLQPGVKLSHPPLINFFFLYQLFIWLLAWSLVLVSQFNDLKMQRPENHLSFDNFCSIFDCKGLSPFHKAFIDRINSLWCMTLKSSLIKLSRHISTSLSYIADVV